jgi:hypothetical protein
MTIDKPLSGVVIHLHSSIPHLRLRKPHLTHRLEELGASISAACERNVTHCVLGGEVDELLSKVSITRSRSQVWMLREEWLDKVCISAATSQSKGPYHELSGGL